jgi:hypothetical protein
VKREGELHAETTTASDCGVSRINCLDRYAALSKQRGVRAGGKARGERAMVEVAESER